MSAKIIHAVTIANSLNLMRGQLKYLKEQGFDVRALCSDGDYIEGYEKSEGVEVLKVDMEREISLGKDLASLYRNIKVMRKERPDIVSAGTPKAGLIVTLAAYLCGVPVRVYNIRGLRLETTTGLKREILLTMEKIAAASATHVLAVSPSLRERVVELGIVKPEKVVVLGKGSSNGYSLERFHETEEVQNAVKEKRAEIGLSDDNVVIGFVGRLTKDKGVEEMVDVFLTLQAKHSQVRLLIVGEYETGDSVKDSTRREIEGNPGIIHVGYQRECLIYYRLMDVFVLLTKREGFCNVSLEASLTGLPIVVTNVTGAKDTVKDEETGFLVEVNDPQEIVKKLELLIAYPYVRKLMGENGKKWAQENFSSVQVWSEMSSKYETWLNEKASLPTEVRFPK